MSRVVDLSMLGAQRAREELGILSGHMKKRTGAIGQSMTLLQTSINTLMTRPTKVVGFVSTTSF